jgi:spermidine synthase
VSQPYVFVLQVASLETGRGKLARVYDMRSHNSLSMTRQFYLDGVLKSNSLGHAAAHESFVHPAMLTHEAPQRVLILGDQTGASVREVLKHPGVVDVTVVGADQSLTDFSRTHLSEWNDCGGVSCFDDDRVQFIPYSKNPKDWVTSLDGGMFDVILLDFL